MGLTYNGATAASTAQNPLVELDSVVGGFFPYATTGGSTRMWSGRLWMWASTSDVVDLVGLNAVNDGLSLGVRPGDILLMVSGTDGSTSPKLQLGVFAAPATAATTGICLSSNILSSTAV